MSPLEFLKSCEPNDINVEFEYVTRDYNTMCVTTKDDSQTVLLNVNLFYEDMDECQRYCQENNITIMVMFC